MEEAGDAVITYRSPVSKKLKYNVCTLEFDSCNYIKEKNQKKRYLKGIRLQEIMQVLFLIKKII